MRSGKGDGEQKFSRLRKERRLHLIENSHFKTGTEAFGAPVPIALQENLVNGVYASVDSATTSILERLRNEDGLVPTCRLGCSHCCRYHILTNIAEAHTLAQYIKREWSADQINDLRIRTQQWHAWDYSRPGRYLRADIGETLDLADYEHYCPLLVNDTCSAYPVRPIICRTHFVSSAPLFCRTANDPESTMDAPEVLTSVVTATRLLSMAIRDHIESAGLDFSRSMMLLPHGLALEMGWDFDSWL
jgi:Fe-S-cluster containining protein